MKTKNTLFAFFASVKLALFTLFLLAVTSIIGTVIPQKESPQYYVQNFGEMTANIFQVLSIPDMYNSWWFLSLLTLLSLNLIICSIDRFPGVWKQIKKDNLATDLSRLKKMRLSHTWNSKQPESSLAAGELTKALADQGWKAEQRQTADNLLLFAQKGAMTRTGVYIVHASILVIFVGAIIGEIWGFKGSIMLPETRSTKSIYEFNTQRSIPLGFEVRCNLFGIDFYETGMPRTYRSDLTVLENGKVILDKQITVNDPLTYKGITFYQSSYQSYEDFLITVTDQQTGVAETATMSFQQPLDLSKHNAKIGVINAQAMGQTISNMKIWFDDDQGPPSTFWLDAGDQVTVERPGKTYTIFAKQMYATGLQVAKDPGVWVVYIGCGMMILGLFVAFFMSHRRIWLLLSREGDNTTILMTGSANKNKDGFEKTFTTLTEQLTGTSGTQDKQ